MGDERHEERYRCRRVRKHRLWRAECSCGWVGTERDSSGYATKDFDRHLADEGPPPNHKEEPDG